MPKYHLFRMTESAADHSYLYNIAGDIYCPDNVRPSIDSIVLFKIVLIRYYLWHSFIKNIRINFNEYCLQLVIILFFILNVEVDR